LSTWFVLETDCFKSGELGKGEVLLVFNTFIECLCVE